MSSVRPEFWNEQNVRYAWQILWKLMQCQADFCLPPLLLWSCHVKSLLCYEVKASSQDPKFLLSWFLPHPWSAGCVPEAKIKGVATLSTKVAIWPETIGQGCPNFLLGGPNVLRWTSMRAAHLDQYKKYYNNSNNSNNNKCKNVYECLVLHTKKEKGDFPPFWPWPIQKKKKKKERVVLHTQKKKGRKSPKTLYTPGIQTFLFFKESFK